MDERFIEALINEDEQYRSKDEKQTKRVEG
jgi:hypothetical protein